MGRAEITARRFLLGHKKSKEIFRRRKVREGGKKVFWTISRSEDQAAGG